MHEIDDFSSVDGLYAQFFSDLLAIFKRDAASRQNMKSVLLSEGRFLR